MPLNGNQPKLITKMKINIIAKKKLGIEIPINEKTVQKLSNTERLSTAALIPITKDNAIAKIYPNAKRVIITDNENPEFEIVALKEKIDLFLLKKRGSQLALDSIKVLEEEILSKVEMEKFLIGSDCKLKMNLVNHVVTVDNEIVHLTPKEFEILKLLIENRGQYLSRQLIIDKVWSDSIDKEIRIVDTHIKKIREKT